MIIDGRAISAVLVAEIHREVQKRGESPTLAIFTCAPNFETQKFLMIKEQQASAAGITLTRFVLPDTVTLAEVQAAITEAAVTHDGIIIQFPFPHLATADLIPLVPASHDVDVMQYDGRLTEPLPPVVGAIDTIVRKEGIVFAGKRVVVVGQGRLVGTPASLYATNMGAEVVVVTKDSNNLDVVARADILILGAGVPGLITPALVKEGVIVFDAGTTEEGGVLAGDAVPEVAEKASLFTPVPGGIGPITVAVLLKNVLHLAR